VGTPVAGVRALHATSPPGGVTVRLSGARSGSGGVTGPPDEHGAGWGLATGDRGSLDALECPFALCLASKAGERALLACGAAPLAIELAAVLAGVGVLLGG
jgi:hypothetical protein